MAKTTSARNLAYSVGELWQRVVTVDFDPQSNLTASFADDTISINTTIAEVMNKAMDEEEIPEKKTYFYK